MNDPGSPFARACLRDGFKRPIDCMRGAASLILAATLLAGCTSTFEKREVNHKPTELVLSKADTPDNELLGVRIKTFSPGELPEDEEQSLGLSPKIRDAEGYVIAVKLRETMQKSGHWGPVRAVPADSEDGDVQISGEIIESDGELLKIRIDVADATGTAWYSREYAGVVNEEVYEQSKKSGRDPFQFLYNQISNDIAKHRAKLDRKGVETIRTVAELRFAERFAPQAFSGYLEKSGGAEKNPEAKKTEQEQKDAPDPLAKLFNLIAEEKSQGPAPAQYRVVRLPSKDDPIFRRIKRIRAREHVLIDTLDLQYAGLANNITEAYTQWRTSRLAEMNAVREIERLEQEQTAKAVAGVILGIGLAVLGSQANCTDCGTVGAVAGGVVLARSIELAIEARAQRQADMEIHARALEELGESLATEVEPIILEVEGRTVELKGTVEQKFVQWRQIMRKLYESEVGPIAPDAPANPTAEPGTKKQSAG